MSLRAKLFLPLIVISMLVIAYVNISWLPQFTDFAEARHKQQLIERIDAIGQNMALLLAKGQRRSVYDSLGKLLLNNSEWRGVRLLDTNGKPLYRKETKTKKLPQSDAVYTLRQPVSHAGKPLGALLVTVDTTERLRAVHELQRYSIWVFLVILLILTVTIAVIFELVIRRPIKALSTASARLAKGDFETPLPEPGADEMGTLVSTFTSMRDAIQRFQSDLSFQSTHDPLTGLVNRREFERRLEAALNVTRSELSEHALLYMDLDQFKVVNDTCGHTAGDEFLRQLGAELHRKVRKHDTLARLGGDEFGVLLEHCPAEQASRIANELLETIRDFRFVWEGKSFTLGVSIGLVPIGECSGSLSKVLSTADATCYAAKDAGRNRIHVYRDDDSILVRRHGEMQWVPRITEAIQGGHFHLYYQLIVPVSGEEEGVHFEFLLRMEDEDGSIIPPRAFLHAAERYNLMLSLDRWVTQTAFQWLQSHPEQLDHLKLCTINLSGHSLGDADFMQFIIKELNESTIPPEKICFEVTETAAIGNLMKATRFMSILRNLGCRFSLDDFGSGMSSFAYLKELPVDYLKIDGIFVKDIADDPIDYAMVKAINEMGHVMGKETVAEFVEKEAILWKLREIGVDYAQGYAIAKPRPLIEMDSGFLLNQLRLTERGG
ncbi:MAG: EAL domain-containing protein [Acidiferrobacterales bacterium]